MSIQVATLSENAVSRMSSLGNQIMLALTAISRGCPPAILITFLLSFRLLSFLSLRVPTCQCTAICGAKL